MHIRKLIIGSACLIAIAGCSPQPSTQQEILSTSSSSSAVSLQSASTSSAGNSVHRLAEEEQGITHNPDFDVIQQYYDYLAQHELEKAYAMHVKKPATFERFTEWYGDTSFVVPYKIQSENPNEYTFFVNIQSGNAQEEKYTVTMRVVESGQIQTVSSKKIEMEKVTAGNVTVYLKEQRASQLLIKREGERETIIDNGGPILSGGDRSQFSNLKVSADGKHLLVSKLQPLTPVEAVHDTLLIDLEKGSVVQNFSCPDTVQFTPNGQHLLACAFNGFCGELYATVYKLADFSVAYDAVKEYGAEIPFDATVFDCRYNDKNNEFEFKFPKRTLRFKPS